MTTTTIYGGSGDGDIQSGTSDNTYSQARAGQSLYASPFGTKSRVGQIREGQTFDFYIFEAFVRFDTSVIGAGDTITDADLSLRITDHWQPHDFTVEAREHPWGTSVTTADWVAGANLSSLTRVATLDTDALTAARYDMVSDGTNLIDAINPSGFVDFVLCSDEQTNNIEPGGPSTASADEIGFYKTAQAGTTDDPKLVIVHEVPAITVNLGQATETEAVNPLTVLNPKTYQLGRATETDVVNPLTVSNPSSYELGRVTETDIANPLTVSTAVNPFYKIKVIKDITVSHGLEVESFEVGDLLPQWDPHGKALVKMGFAFDGGDPSNY